MTYADYARHGYIYRNWYDRQNKHLGKIARQFNWDKQLFIDIVAMTSVRATLKKNLNLAVTYMKKKHTVRLLPNVQIMFNKYESSGKVPGIKVERFARALQGDKSAIVLDTHMAKVMNVNQSQFATVKNYKKQSLKIANAARRFGMCPRDFQAAVWCGMFVCSNRPVREYEVQEIIL